MYLQYLRYTFIENQEIFITWSLALGYEIETIIHILSLPPRDWFLHTFLFIFTLLAVGIADGAWSRSNVFKYESLTPTREINAFIKSIKRVIANIYLHVTWKFFSISHKIVHFTFKYTNITSESMSQIFELVNNLSKFLCPNAALVKYIKSRIIPAYSIWFSNSKSPNPADDQQGRIKIPVLPDLYKAKSVRHLNMLRLVNTEKKCLPFL